MHAIELLLDDHESFTALFDRVRSAPDGMSHLPAIKAAIEVHKHVEEKVLYPHLLAEADDQLKALVHASLEDHGLVRGYITELEQLADDGDYSPEKLNIVMEDIRHQADVEEETIFPLIEAQFDEEMLEALGNEMEAERERFLSGGTINV
jgi:hemerythrin-like domain-containing protein